MHIPSVSVELGTAIYLLFTNSFHFTGSWTCWISEYPLNCSVTEGVTFQAGQNACLYRLWLNCVPLWTCGIIITCTMVSIYLTLYRAEKATTAQYITGTNSANESKNSQTKSAATQALLYNLAFYITWFFTTFPIIEGLFYDFNPSGNTTFFLEVLQGLWNCVIYLRPRYLSKKQSNPPLFETNDAKYYYSRLNIHHHLYWNSPFGL